MKLFYRQFGAGDPVVILHGVFGLSDNWVTVGRRLGEHFSVFIPDLRNHGHSPHSPALNYYALVDDLLEFLEAHELKNPVLVGHSMGGKAVMNFVLDTAYPVKKLVVIDIAPKPYPARQEHLQIIHAMQSVDFDIHTSRQAVESALIQWLNSERLRYFILKNLYRTGHDRFAWRVNLAAIQENLELISGTIPSMGTFNGEVLAIRGEHSDYITEADEFLFKQYFPQVIFRTIPQASHWVHADQPDELCRELITFLKDGRVTG